MGLVPEREFPLKEAGCAYVVDLAIPCRDGTLSIVLNDRPGPSGALRFSSRDLPAEDMEVVAQAVEKLGGAQLPE